MSDNFEIIEADSVDETEEETSLLAEIAGDVARVVIVNVAASLIMFGVVSAVGYFEKRRMDKLIKKAREDELNSTEAPEAE